MKQLLHNIYYSFPLRLLVLHLRNNHLLLFFWLLLGAMITGNLGKSLGIKYLFLDPEYHGKVGFWSFFIIGFSFSAFLMSWNITIYILKSYRFPFLASLHAPFAKFCLNNTILPVTFLCFYIANVINFQWYNEYAVGTSIFYCILGFVGGFSLSLILTALYFNLTNKDIFSFLKKANPKPGAPGRPEPSNKAQRMFRIQMESWRVDYYLNLKLKARRVRDVTHYDPDLLIRVFYQNHVNAFIIQVVSIVVLVVLSIMIDNVWFRIPAAASIFILAAVLTNLLGALSFWLKGWRTTAVVLLFLGINYVTSDTWMAYRNMAYGLNYNVEKADYSYKTLDSIGSAKNIRDDSLNTISTLDNWSNKFGSGLMIRKPKMVVVSLSGGGLRSTIWAVKVMQEADSLTKGRLMNRTVLMTGASGGMFGAAFFRDLYWEKQKGNPVNLYDNRHISVLSRDMLNPICFTVITNDIFMPWRKFERGGYSYFKDRGYVFEQQLIENSGGLLDKTINDYQEAEQQAVIPMMFITPVVINDGRSLIISAQPVAYMTRGHSGSDRSNVSEVDGVDFGRFFKAQNGSNLSMSSALRMNSTFPYILPNVHLPTTPGIEVVDAGWKDNFGMSYATRFAYFFRDWIKENTSGVVFVSIRDSEKIEDISKDYKRGMLDKFFNPVGIAVQLSNIQDYNHDRQVNYLSTLFGEDMIDVVHFVYKASKVNERAALSLHMTAREKLDISNAILLDENKESMKRLQGLLR